MAELVKAVYGASLISKSYSEQGKNHQNVAHGAGQSDVKIEQNKEFLSKPTHTVIDPRTVMVHLIMH